MNDTRPFPPGDYPLIVVGTGPGGLQASYSLRRLGIEHALLSKDPGPGGMFRRFPMFGRLITCSRPRAIVDCGCPAYFRYDWNSMVTNEPAHQALVTEFMDGDNYFPTREEMELSLATFADRGGVAARYDCTWESTRQEDDGTFVLGTSDGEYRAKIVVFAVGMIEPWRPPTPGIEDVPHYVDIADRGIDYLAGKRVFIIGKRNSGFEIANGLLPHACQLILGSPHGVRPSIATGFPTAPRARYVQPLEDALFGGGTFVVNVALESIQRTADGYTVHAEGTTGLGKVVFDVDEVIACTGFATGLGDLRGIGVQTFYKDRLPPRPRTGRAPRCRASTSRAPQHRGRPGCASTGGRATRPRSAGSASTPWSRRATSRARTSGSTGRVARSIPLPSWTTCSIRRPPRRRSGHSSPTWPAR